MKNVISKTKYVLMALIMVVSFSCSPEDGADGAQGPAGQDGTNGQDGEDGNANVQTFIFDISGVSGSSYTQSIPELTQDVIDNDVILGYVNRGAFQYPLPAIKVQGIYDIRTLYRVGNYLMNFDLSSNGNNHNISAGDLEELKIIIIESSNTTAGRSTSTSKKQNVFNELKAAGVDVNNYNEVMDYYGLDY
ncbi:MAG: hypothetical protein L3J20_02370 [Flavobacteriaceae bacterium]|nr:hypothetical protein [Flavobacteriaceae bacterium]